MQSIIRNSIFCITGGILMEAIKYENIVIVGVIIVALIIYTIYTIREIYKL